MKVSELIMHLQECIERGGDKEVLLMPADPDEGDYNSKIVGADVYYEGGHFCYLLWGDALAPERFHFEEGNKEPD